MAAKKTEKQSLGAQILKSARAAGGRVFMYAFWILVLGGLAASVYLFFFTEQTPEARKSPDSTLDLYTEFVRPYVPPGSLKPSQATVDDWLDYFNKDSRRWFRDNVDRITYMDYANEPNGIETWSGMAPGKREMEAMRSLLKRGPLRGGVVISQEMDAGGGVAQLRFTTGSAQYQISMEKVDGAWVFQDFMGVRGQLVTRLEQVRLPEENK